MKYVLFLLMIAISFMSPIVACVARKELSDAAKAGLICYGLAMMMFAFTRALRGLPDL